jgi:hypothetical protein
VCVGGGGGCVCVRACVRVCVEITFGLSQVKNVVLVLQCFSGNNVPKSTVNYFVFSTLHCADKSE